MILIIQYFNIVSKLKRVKLHENNFPLNYLLMYNQYPTHSFNTENHIQSKPFNYFQKPPTQGKFLLSVITNFPSPSKTQIKSLLNPCQHHSNQSTYKSLQSLRFKIKNKKN